MFMKEIELKSQLPEEKHELLGRMKGPAKKL